MPDNEEMARNIRQQYFFKVIKAFNEMDGSANAIEILAKSLKDIYRYFEPAYYKGELFIVKSLTDNSVLSTEGVAVYDKNIFLNRLDGNMVIQVYDDGTMKLWENVSLQSPDKILNVLIYKYVSHVEKLYANGEIIDITAYQKGSRFATQYEDLLTTLREYGNSKLFQSSCSSFSKSWEDPNRLFFKGGGRGSNIPEGCMQESLLDYLSTTIGRGISMDTVREYNINGDFNKPKPVDVKLTWREANRVAIIELKFLGTVKPSSGGKAYTHEDARANEGLVQLKGYHDKILTDAPTTILKSYLVVIEGRRKDLDPADTTISYVNGMFFNNIDLSIDNDKKYFDTIPGFEKPIKLFAAPITT